MNSIIQSPHNTTPIPKTEEDILIIYIMSHPTYYYTSNYPQMQNFNLLKKLQISFKELHHLRSLLDTYYYDTKTREADLITKTS